MYTHLFSVSLHRKMRGANDSKLLRDLSRFQGDGFNSGSDRAYHLRNNGMISYLPAGKEPVFDNDGMWAHKGRVETKIGRALKAMLVRFKIDAAYTDADLEKAVHILTAVADETSNEVFLVVKGKEIHDWYNTKSALSGSTSTCMVGKDRAMLNLYTENPELVNLVVLTDKEHRFLIGRAILWLKTTQGVIMDRIYGEPHVQSRFKKYAHEQGWAYKVNQSRGEGHFKYPPIYADEGELRDIKIPIPTTKLKMFPYLDSVMNVYKWGVSSKRAHAVKAAKDAEMPLTKDFFLGVANKTDGGLSERTIVCAQCQALGSPESMRNINHQFYCPEHTVVCVIDSQHILATDAVRLESGEYARRTSPHLAMVNGKYYNGRNSDKVVKIGTTWYLKTDVVQEAKHNAWILKEHAIHIDDFNVYLDRTTYVQDMEEFGFVMHENKWWKKDELAKKLAEAAAPKAKGSIIAKNEEDDAPILPVKEKKKRAPAKKKLTPEPEKEAVKSPLLEPAPWRASNPWGNLTGEDDIDF